MESRYPIIKDKREYAAVQTAQEQLRAVRWKVICEVAEKYSVDPAMLLSRITERERIDYSPSTDRIYKYFVMVTCGVTEDGEKKLLRSYIKRGKTRKNICTDYSVEGKPAEYLSYAELFDKVVMEKADLESARSFKQTYDLKNKLK